MSGRTIRQRLLATTTVAGAVLLAMPAFAQTTQEAPTAPAADNPAPSTPPAVSSDGAQTADTSSGGGDIVVTGSRIPHPDLESASPVTIVGAQEVAVSGVTRTEDLLNALPQVFAGQGSNIVNGSTGTATVDLRNLGAKRTLVLVNGRRLVPGDPRAPEQDINIIPAALLKRVDVLSGGASSVYGADAVSGVVNFVMDTEFDGFKVDGQYSFYNHDNRVNGNVTGPLKDSGFGYPRGLVSDGGAIDVSAVFGAGFDDGRGHVTAYGNYRKIDPVTQDNRDYSACALSGNSPADIAALGYGYSCGGSPNSESFYAQGQYYLVRGNQFVPGQVLYNFAPANYFQRPDERYSAGFFAHYDVADAFKPYAEFMFMDDKTVAQIAPSGIFLGNTNSINCDNPLLSAQQLAIACAPGNVTTGADGISRGTFYIGRRNTEGGPRQDTNQHTTYRGVIGAKGDIFKGVSYDASYQYSRVNFQQIYLNDLSVTRIGRSIDVVDVNGTPTCRSVVDGSDPTCVPYNIFTQGGVTQAALNYLTIPLFSSGSNTEQIANASFTILGGEYGVTSPFATEGVGINFGAEYRKEKLEFNADANFQNGEGAGQGAATLPTKGQFDVREGFVELSLPLVQDRPFFEDLRFGAGYRRSNYKTNGNGVKNSFDTDTYKFDGSWAPIRDIKLRASYNRSVRAPNIVELFGPQTIALDGSVDPCAGTIAVETPKDVPPPSASQAACALTGLTAAQYGNIGVNAANQYNGLVGGEATLTPEIADSYTAGVVLTPSFLRGFQATVDVFNIKLKNRIGPFGADTIITQCVATGDPAFCNLINRGVSGRLDRPDGYITDINVNAGKLSTKGLDVTVGYTQELGRFGTLGLSMVGTYLDSIVTDNAGPSKYDCKGFYGVQCGTPSPEWRHKARATFTLPQGPSASLAWRYFSGVKADVLSNDVDLAAPPLPAIQPSGTFAGNRVIDSQSYFDVSFTYPVADKFTFQVGANNVLDRQPPINGQGIGTIQNGNTFAQVYDALGRYIFMGVTLDL